MANKEDMCTQAMLEISSLTVGKLCLFEVVAVIQDGTTEICMSLSKNDYLKAVLF